MKVVEMNTVPYGSTGRIAQNIAKVARQSGHEAYFVCGWTKRRKKSIDEYNIVATSFWSKAIHLLLVKVFGLDGFGSFLATKRLVKKLRKIEPDIIHLHIMHDAFLHLPTLLDYISEYDIPVCWTFHDCWAFTGGCPYFTLTQCDKWHSDCNKCPYWKSYSLVDGSFSKKQFSIKKKMAANINRMLIATPSEWLSKLVGESFFKNFDHIVINNGIDLEVFKNQKGNFRKRYSCEGKKIVLGVAFDWGERKGLDIFNNLADLLPQDYAIVLVGTNETIDKQIDSRIISIHKTHSQDELAKIYSEADVFVNPTRQDNFPTVNIEALSCGTPVITFNTGGSPEVINDTCGFVVDEKSAEGLLPYIFKVCEEKVFDMDACRERAKVFEEKKAYEKYVNAYLQLLKEGQ